MPRWDYNLGRYVEDAPPAPPGSGNPLNALAAWLVGGAAKGEAVQGTILPGVPFLADLFRKPEDRRTLGGDVAAGNDPFAQGNSLGGINPLNQLWLILGAVLVLVFVLIGGALAYDVAKESAVREITD